MKQKEISIIYEDEEIVAVNKPAGLIVHSDGRTDEATLSDWVLENYPGTKEVGESIILSDGREIKKHGIVHRLDRGTSGVMLVAKNQETFLFLKRQFQDRKVKKVYRTIVYGKFNIERGTVDKPIGKSKSDFRRFAVGGDARGVLREATTEYKVLYRTTNLSKSGAISNKLQYPCGAKEFSYLEIYPKTGRTHQIRVHLKSIQHPVVCDKLYAPRKECAFGFERSALHALSIDFSLRENKRMKIEAPLPEDFIKAEKEIKKME